ncbi:hypothetical protein [Nocardia fusca]|uniref:NHL repeat-containing protein n=1 Tax=Nocardia fusca TaxID=941183 RepID=A0ABV3FKB7_9NOCA
MGQFGTLVGFAGTGEEGFSGDGGRGIDARFDHPFGVAVDSRGNVYICDVIDRRVRKVDVNGIITTFAGTGELGCSGDGGPATAASFNAPNGLAVDSADNLYICDGEGLVRKVDVRGVITTVVGDDSCGVHDGDGSHADPLPLSGPLDVAVDAHGNVYIAASEQNKVRKVADKLITTIAGTGRRGCSGDGGPATAAELNFPSGVAVDSRGNVYVSDEHNHRVRKVDSDTGIITTVAGTGEQGFSGDGGPATAARLDSPSGLTVDWADNLYIADEYNHRVRKVDPNTGIITTVAGGDSSNGEYLDRPITTTLDRSGNLYIVDINRKRVLATQLSPVPTPFYGWAGRSRDGHLEVFSRRPGGGELDHWYQSGPGGKWVCGQPSSTTGRVDGEAVIATNADGRLEVFVTYDDGTIHHGWEHALLDWEPTLNGALTPGFMALLDVDGCLEVFATAKDGTLHRNRQTTPGGADWWHHQANHDQWEHLGGDLAPGSRPAAACDGDGCLHVFARFTDNTIQHLSQNSDGSWPAQWQPLAGGRLAGNPVAVNSADGRLALFGRGLDDTLHHCWQDPALAGGWSDWIVLRAHTMTGDPVVAMTSDQRLSVLARSPDGGLYQLDETGPNLGWHKKWLPLSGSLAETIPPAVVLNNAGQLEIFARFTDGTVQHRTDTTRWQPLPVPPHHHAPASTAGNDGGKRAEADDLSPFGAGGINPSGYE